MSLAIFISATASPRSAACARTMASSEPWAANLLGAVTNGLPVSSAISAAMSAPNPGGAFSPVPTAVPPTASSIQPFTRVADASMQSVRSAPRSRTTPARRSGATASSRWVRPILTTSSQCCGLYLDRRLRSASTLGIRSVVELRRRRRCASPWGRCRSATAPC